MAVLSNNDIRELKCFADWLTPPGSFCAVPDVCRGDVEGWVMDRQHRNVPSPVHKEILGWVNHSGSGCPDVEIGYLLDLVKARLAPKLSESIKEVLGDTLASITNELTLKNKTTKELSNILMWRLVDEIDPYCNETNWKQLCSDEIAAALQLLKEAGIVMEKDSVWNLA